MNIKGEVVMMTKRHVLSMLGGGKYVVGGIYNYLIITHTFLTDWTDTMQQHQIRFDRITGVLQRSFVSSLIC